MVVGSPPYGGKGSGTLHAEKVYANNTELVAFKYISENPDSGGSLTLTHGNGVVVGSGDPKGSAGNVINCRCSVAVVPKRDDNGNLVPSM